MSISHHFYDIFRVDDALLFSIISNFVGFGIGFRYLLFMAVIPYCKETSLRIED